MKTPYHAYTDNQFKEFLNENPQFDHRKFDLWYEEGEFSGILILKKWGHHKDLVAYVKLETGEHITCAAYYEEDYLGFKDIPLGTYIRLTFKKTKSGDNRLRMVEVRNSDLQDITELLNCRDEDNSDHSSKAILGKIYTWDDFPETINTKEYHLNTSRSEIEGILTARRYGDNGKMVAYIAPDFCIGKKFHGIKSTVYEDDNFYLGLPYIAEGTHVHVRYDIHGRYCRVVSIEAINNKEGEESV